MLIEQAQPIDAYHARRLRFDHYYRFDLLGENKYGQQTTSTILYIDENIGT